MNELDEHLLLLFFFSYFICRRIVKFQCRKIVKRLFTFVRPLGIEKKKSLKAVKPYLSKAPAPWWDLKGGTPITTRQVQLTDPFFTGGVIVFLVKKLMHVEESYSPIYKGNIGFSSSLRPYY